MTFADLETASSVLLVCFEPEEEAGAVFLRLRKANRKQGLKSWTARALPEQRRPQDRRPAAAGGARRARPPRSTRCGSKVPLDANSVILVGERAAGLSGTLSALLRLAERTGARLAWVPRRAGDRGAVEAGCLPNLLPGGRPVADAAARVDTQTTWGVDSLPSLEGRDGDEMLISAADGELARAGGGRDRPERLRRPAVVLEGLEAVDFVVSLETRASLVTERADVVFPVSLIHQRAGSFVNWEGRVRSFQAVINEPTAMSDLRVLAALADGFGVDLGFRTAAAGAGRAGGARRLGGRPGRRPPTSSPARRAGRTTGRPCSRPGGCRWTTAGPWTASPSCGRPSARRSPGSVRVRGRGTRLGGGDLATTAGRCAFPWSSTRPWSTASSGCRAERRSKWVGAGSWRPRPATVVDRSNRSTAGGGAVTPLRPRCLHERPWWVVLLKALFAFVLLLVLTLFTIWYERRVVAFMQHRKGPNMNGPFGLLQSLADGMKLMFKEDFTPDRGRQGRLHAGAVRGGDPGHHRVRGDPDRR